MTRSRDVSAVQNNLGVAIPPAAAGKNAVINGGFDIWQRGTSFTAGSVYTADRWYRDGNAGRTFSRQTTSDTTNLPNIQYCMRVQRDSGNTSTSVMQLGQSFETVNSIPFAGKTVTFSFYARAGANYSAASSALAFSVRTGTGTDQNLFSGYTGQALPISSSATLTTTWQRFTASATLSSTATELGVLFEGTPVGTAGAADYFEVTGVQLELGSSATPFSRAGGTIQGELAACQRYYQRYATAAYARAGIGMAGTTTAAYIQIASKTTFRVTPTSVDYSTMGLWDAVNAVIAVSSITIDSGNSDFNVLNFTATGLTQYRTYQGLNNNSSTGYLGLSAEL